MVRKVNLVFPDPRVSQGDMEPKGALDLMDRLVIMTAFKSNDDPLCLCFVVNVNICVLFTNRYTRISRANR